MRGLGAVVAAGLVLLGGCTAVKLRHLQTGAIVGCGVVPILPWYGPERARKEAADELQCIESHERQGYQIARD